MAVDVDAAVMTYANEFTDSVRAGSTESGDSNQIQLLHNLRDSLGDSKLLTDPQFFYWKYSVSQINIELCGYDIDEVDNSLTLFTVDFDEPCHQIDKRIVDRLGSRAANFVRMIISKNKALKDSLENEVSDLADEINSLAASQAGLSKVRVIIVSNGLSVMRNREMTVSIKDTNTDVEYIVWDINWIYQNCQLEKEHEAIILDFKDEDLAPLVGSGLPCLSVPQSDPQFDCYQCVVPGALLAHIYRVYGSPLLEGNVRSFLTTKTAVNKQIQATIHDEPKRFYIYNNGIAAVASGVKTEIVNGTMNIVQIDDIQIINGGQTTASLAFAQRKREYDLSSIFVPMKLTVIHSSEESDDESKNFNALIQKISRTSNSQNKVSDADFFANHPFHSAMKKFSRDLYVPGLNYNTHWFYERARGEYAQAVAFMTDSQKKNFEKTHPKSMYLTKTDFAKYHGIYNQTPDVVSKGGMTNFNEFAKYINKEYEEGREAKFNEVFFKEICGVAIMYRTLEPLMTTKNQSWYAGGYRANILNYALSLFFYLVKQQSPDNAFDLTVVWDKGVSDNLQSILIGLCQRVYRQLLDPTRAVENVAQWAKKKPCWDQMKSALGDIQIDTDSIGGYFQDKLTVAAKKKAAKQDQQVKNQVDVYSQAFSSANRKLWEPLYYFVHAHKNDFQSFDRKADIALEHMVKSLKGKAVPTQEECVTAFSLLEEARLLGFNKIDE